MVSTTVPTPDTQKLNLEHGFVQCLIISFVLQYHSMPLALINGLSGCEQPLLGFALFASQGLLRAMVFISHLSCHVGLFMMSSKCWLQIYASSGTRWLCFCTPWAAVQGGSVQGGGAEKTVPLGSWGCPPHHHPPVSCCWRNGGSDAFTQPEVFVPNMGGNSFVINCYNHTCMQISVMPLFPCSMVLGPVRLKDCCWDGSGVAF